MTRAEQERAERRERILETARRLIAEHGYDGVGMRELARESRCSVPTLYKLFGDKAALLVAAVESHFSGLMRRIDRQHSATGRELAVAVFEGCCRELRRLPRYSRAVMAVFVSSGQTPELREVVARATIHELEVAVGRLREEGELAEWVEPRVLAERLGSHLMMVTLEWATGALSDRGLDAAMLYGASLTLAGATRGEARREFERRARALQADAALARGRAGGSGSSSSSGSQAAGG